MLIQHRTTCPYCSKPLSVSIEATKPETKAVGTTRCGNCKEVVALDYEVHTDVKVTLGRISWDRPTPLLATEHDYGLDGRCQNHPDCWRVP